jgi:hypothetical protein
MSTADKFRDYAADCVQKASGTSNPEEKNLHLNMALAWVRLAHQSEAILELADKAQALSVAPEPGEVSGQETIGLEQPKQ